ncbi:MAG TPA: MBL fold metallo-hydrolase [Deltaproteobacteria bacterium]|nr:MBL fold metallo-hydrolase [Deltaproteobacteria bacterium]HPR56077.1 MBL fold metallo-hydrolase [Deltaproteobacteria bacterium]HXK47873.1 MBL fold metallo-hydrolase [Deltaproteobacteria bacterium]
MKIREVDKVEVLTLQDNYIDITALDNTAVVQRATPLKDMQIKSSILAEHGFSALVTIHAGGRASSLLFDFGFSDDGAARNAVLLGADVGSVKAMVLSHGHSDHTGGIQRFSSLITGKKDAIEFVCHPGAFIKPRYLKFGEEIKVYFPEFSRETVLKEGIGLVETSEPHPLLDGCALFLGEVPRLTDFEKGFPIAHREEDGKERWDPIEDDSGIAVNVRGKGLVVLTGCAHAGVINTVRHAMRVTGVDRVCAVMGGFHLSGPFFEPIIERTTDELKALDPLYVVPTHCTGRRAVMHIEREMPEKFILNMSGTKLTFSA